MPDNFCYLCGSPEFSILNDSVRGEVGGGKNIKVLKCDECGLVRLSSTSHITDELYESSGMLASCPVDVKIAEEKSMEDTLKRINLTCAHIRDKSVLDFGCGSGAYLKHAKPLASSVCGVELDKHFTEEYHRNGISVFRSLEDLPEEKFDVITMFHVIEHLRDPLKVIKDLKKFMHNDSLLIIETPNSDDALLSFYHSKEFANFTYWAYHLYLYNESTLRLLLDNAGMDLDKSGHGIQQHQRYPLANHLYWLSQGKPNGHNIYSSLRDRALEEAYCSVLSRNKMCDTIIAVCGV